MRRLVYGHGGATQETETHRRASLATERDGGRDVETGRTRGVQSHDSDYNRSALNEGHADVQASRAALKLARAKRWRHDNEQVWAFMVSRAMRLAEAGQPIAVQSLIEQAREKAFVDRHGRDTKINNDFAPIFARWLIREHPEMEPLIERRRSVFDSLVVCDG